MNNDQLENFIEQAKRSEVPNCPGSVQHNVLRRIRLASVESEQSAWDWLIRLLPQPGFVVGAIAMVAVVSSGITIFSTQFNAVQQDSHLLAVRVLDFNVFQQTELFHFNEH